MLKLLSGILLVLASSPPHAFIAAQETPGTDTGTIVWILVGVFVFFAIVFIFTWQLVKSERQRALEKSEGKPQE